MRPFKIIDLLISVLLIGAYLAARCWSDFMILFEAYFVVGSWQVISMIVHRVKNCFVTRGSIRSTYHWIVVFILITMPIGSVWILYFAAPLMALFYCGLCFYEIRKMADRPLSVLK